MKREFRYFDNKMIYSEGKAYTNLEKMYYSGINDYRGKKIYEKDIVYAWTEEDYKIGVVKDDCGYVIDWRHSYALSDLIENGYKLKVLGNRIEHPQIIYGMQNLSHQLLKEIRENL